MTRSDIDINRQDILHLTAIYHAANGGHNKVVSMLLAQEAKVHLPRWGESPSPRMTAIREAYSDVVKLLLEYGATVQQAPAPMVHKHHYC
ncbi:hypothetical protein V8C44DRAFT_343702 [Trichoderma aethiopicum]